MLLGIFALGVAAGCGDSSTGLDGTGAGDGGGAVAQGGQAAAGGSSGGSAPGGQSTGGQATGGQSSAGQPSGGESNGGTPGGAGTAPVLDGTPVLDERVLVEARSLPENGGVTFGWPGSAVRARFEGTAIAVELDERGNNRYAVYLDNTLVRVVAPERGRSRVTAAWDLDPGTHELRWVKLTEQLVGESTVFGVVVGGGALSAAPAPRKHRIEIIGDSISCGYGVEGADKTCPFSAATENVEFTYGALAAATLDAELRVTAWSGKGVFTNRGSTSDTVPMPVLFQQTLPGRSEPKWDFSWQPELLVIALGTNDFAETVKDVTPFQPAYEQLLKDVRTRYPTAQVVCTLGPLLSDWWPVDKKALTTARTAIQGAITARKTAGDNQLDFLEYPVVDEATEGYGCDWHPSKKTQARMGTALTTFVRDKLGW